MSEVISLEVFWENALKESLRVLPSSARSTRDRVVCWPRHCWAQTSTKSSTICLPSSSVEVEVFWLSLLSQLV